MKVEVKCVIRDDEGNIVREFTVVEFESVNVIEGDAVDGSDN